MSLNYNNCMPDSPWLKNVYVKHEELFKFWLLNRDKMGSSILNIGLDTHVDGHSGPWVDWFINKMNYSQVGILDIYEENIKFFKKKFKDRDNIEFIVGDVCEASKHITKKYDTIFWHHGPEHIPLDKLPIAYKELKFLANKCLLFVCPWGTYYKIGIGTHLGDDHHYFPENENFLDLGMEVFNEGGPYSTGHANIVAYNFL